MYFIPQGNDRPHQVGLRGFSDPPPRSEFDISKDKILRALRLNPVGGYVKGSSARRQLDAAVDSVPPYSALDLVRQLEKGKDTLGKLFRYRLADPTQRTMLKTLKIKEAEHLKRKNEVKRRAIEEAEADRQKTCARWREEDMVIKSVCDGRFIGRGRGYFKPGDPVACQTLKDEAQRARTPDYIKDVHCP